MNKEQHPISKFKFLTDEDWLYNLYSLSDDCTKTTFEQFKEKAFNQYVECMRQCREESKYPYEWDEERSAYETFRDWTIKQCIIIESGLIISSVFDQENYFRTLKPGRGDK
jgi:hypothetical protein